MLIVYDLDIWARKVSINHRCLSNVCDSGTPVQASTVFVQFHSVFSIILMKSQPRCFRIENLAANKSNLQTISIQGWWNFTVPAQQRNNLETGSLLAHQNGALGSLGILPEFHDELSDSLQTHQSSSHRSKSQCLEQEVEMSAAIPALGLSKNTGQHQCQRTMQAETEATGTWPRSRTHWRNLSDSLPEDHRHVLKFRPQCPKNWMKRRFCAHP